MPLIGPFLRGSLPSTSRPTAETMSAFISGNKLSITSINPFVLLIAVIGAWILFKTLRFLTQPFRSPLRFINGPPGTSLMFGSLRQLLDTGAYEGLCQWKEQYGHVFVIRAAFGVSIPFASLLPLLT